MTRSWILIALMVGAFFIAADTSSCNEPESDKAQRQQQEQLAQQGNQQVGMPGVTNFTEKRIVRKLYEMRDQSGLATFTYVPDLQGRLWHLCDSFGFGLPYGVQFTNPEKHVWFNSRHFYNIPQPEPNGLFMPPTAEGTWILCANGKKGEFDPVYVEPRVIVSPFKLAAFGEWQK